MRLRAFPYCVIGALLVVSSAGCGDTGVDPPSDVVPDIEPLETFLVTEGRLGFERLGSVGNAFSTVVIVDGVRGTAAHLGDAVFDDAALAPDGRLLAFVRNATCCEGLLRDVYVMDLDTGETADVSGIDGQEGPPAWTPGGAALFFTVDLGTSIALYRVARLGGFQPPVAVDTLHPGNGDPLPVGRLAVSDNGRVLVSDRGRRIVLLDRDGALAELVGPAPPEEGQVVELLEPAWAPDASRFAYLRVVRVGDRSYRSLAVVLADTVGRTLDVPGTIDLTGLRDTAEPPLSLAWSPSGARLALTAPTGSGASSVFILETDAPGVRRLTTMENVTDRSVSWSR